jgi:hypothetical protein
MYKYRRGVASGDVVIFHVLFDVTGDAPGCLETRVLPPLKSNID